MRPRARNPNEAKFHSRCDFIPQSHSEKNSAWVWGWTSECLEVGNVRRRCAPGVGGQEGVRNKSRIRTGNGIRMQSKMGKCCCFAINSGSRLRKNAGGIHGLVER